MIEDEQGVLGQVVEQRLELLVEQRQPVLDAGAALALAHGGIEGVVPRRSELGDIALAEAGDSRLVEENLRHGQQVDRAELAGRTLGLRIEGADGFQGVAEQVQPHRLIGPRREDVDHAPPDRELPPVGDGRGADVAVDCEIALQLGDLHVVPDAGQVAGRLQHFTRRRALQQRRHGDEQELRRFAEFGMSQAAQGGHALGGRTWRRPDTIVGEAVPIGQTQGLHVPCEEAERLGEGLGPLGVARDEDDGRGDLLLRPRLQHVGDGQGVEALGRAGEVEPAGRDGDTLQIRGLRQGRLLDAEVIAGAPRVEAELPDQGQDRHVHIRGRIGLAEDPGVDVVIGLLQQDLEMAQLSLVHALEVSVCERAQDQVRLDEAPVPGAILQLLATRIHSPIRAERPI